MTEHERLMENYEDALLRLLMESAAREEGRRLLSQPGAVPAPEQEDALGDSLRRGLRRERRRRLCAAVLGLTRQTAVFAALAVLIFTSAMAASETLRSAVRISGTPSPAGVSVTDYTPQFEASWLPWGFELRFTDDSPTQYRRHYADSSGNFIDASCLYLEGQGLEVDPDFPGLREVTVNGRAGQLVVSGSIRLIIPVEEQGCVILLLSAGVSQNDILRTAENLIFPWSGSLR